MRDGGHRERRRQRFDVALHIEEIDVAPAQTPLLGFGRTERQSADSQGLGEAVAREDATDLEHANARELSLDVGLQHAEQPREQRRAHHVEMRGDRIQHADRLARRIECAFVVALDETERDNFLPVARDERAP